MELENLKHIWQSQPADDTTRTLANGATQKTYRSKMKKVRYPEIVGSIICIAAAIFIGFRLSALHTGFQQAAGIIAIGLLVLLPLISLASLRLLAGTANVNQPYADALQAFAVQKLRFYRLQKINVTLNCGLLVTVVILLPAFFGSGEVANSHTYWLFSFTIGYIFVVFFSMLVWRYYKKAIRQMEELLRDVEGSRE